MFPRQCNRRQISDSKSLLLFSFLAAFCGLCVESAAAAAIAVPNFADLVESADVVVVGKATQVLPSPRIFLKITSTVGVLLVAVVLMLQKLRHQGLGGVLGLCLFAGLFGLLSLPFFPVTGDSNQYAKVAHISISQTVAGLPATETELRVFYDDGFVCDQTNFVSGSIYLLFLKQISTGYTLSWFDYSQWTIVNGRAHPTVLDQNLPLQEAIDLIRSETNKQASLPICSD